MNEKPPKWVAELGGVREISLLGAADLGFWTERLARERLTPAAQDGRAQLMAVSAEARFRGLAFRELSFSVLVAERMGRAGADAAFLVQAFNSRRLFAFCERVFFATPYDYGDVSLAAATPASLRLVLRGEVAFYAGMHSGESAEPREPAHRGDEGWAGAVFLPAAHGRADRLFFARVAGPTRVYPFVRDRDTLTINPPAGSDGVLQSLIDSGFAPLEWIVRTDATHAKSKTYRRSRLPHVDLKAREPTTRRD